MIPVWVIVATLCIMGPEKPKACSATTDSKAFASEQACKEYAAKTYKHIPTCVQPLQVKEKSDESH